MVRTRVPPLSVGNRRKPLLNTQLDLHPALCSVAVLVLPVDLLAALHPPELVHDQVGVEQRPGRYLPCVLVDDKIRSADCVRWSGEVLAGRGKLPGQVAGIKFFDADRGWIRNHLLSGANVRFVFADQSFFPSLSITTAQTSAMRAVAYKGFWSTLLVWESTHRTSPLWFTAFQACAPPPCQLLTMFADEP